MKIRWQIILVVILVSLIFWPAADRLGLAISRLTTDMAPFDLEPAPRPLIVVACNESGLILRDAKSHLYVYTRGDWIATIAFKQDFKPGDVFCP